MDKHKKLMNLSVYKRMHDSYNTVDLLKNVASDWILSENH